MPKRFNNLKAALKLLRPLTGEGQAADLPDSTALGFYQAVVSGKKIVSYPDRPDGSVPGRQIEYALIPFSTPVIGATKVKTAMSARSEGKLTDADLTANLLNVSKTDDDLGSAVNLFSFIPAKAIVSIKAANQPTGNAATPTSKLTGRKYKKIAKSSFTFPFGFGSDTVGQVTTGKGYKAVKEAIADAVKSATRSVSFSPEKYGS